MIDFCSFLKVLMMFFFIIIIICFPQIVVCTTSDIQPLADLLKMCLTPQKLMRTVLS